MLESEVDKPERESEDHCGDHHKDGRALELAPARPRSLLRELYGRLFEVIDYLTHLYI